MALGPKFDPIEALFGADIILEEFDEYVRQHGSVPQKEELRRFGARLADANQRLGEHLLYYRGATPSRGKFIFSFAVGLGGLLASPPTGGASLIFTAGSVAIALDDMRSYVDNHGQMDRIELRLQEILDALREIDRLTETAT